MNRSFIVKRLAIKFGIATSLTFMLLLVSHQAINNLPDQWVQFHTLSLEKYTAASKGKSDLGNAIHNFKDYVLRRQDYDQKFMADMAMIDQDAASYENNHGDMSEYEMSALRQIKKSRGLSCGDKNSHRNEDIGRVDRGNRQDDQRC